MNSIIKIIFFGLILVSCKKNDPPVQSDDLPNFSNGLLILNEGLFQSNNSSLTFYNFETGSATQNHFLLKNGANLGDVGNEMKRYGNRIYIVVNNSNVVQVIHAETGALLATIPFLDGSTGRSPRSVAFYADKAYVCSFDGTVARIDTTSLTIESYVNAGRNPESICVVGSKLYVSNSGGLDFPNYDSTVSVIDIPTFTETKKINIGINPGKVVADDQGDVYVIRRGDYSAVSSRLFKIDTAIDSVVFELTGVDVNGIEYSSGKLYYSYQDVMGGAPQIGIFNTQTEAIENSNWTDLSQVNTLYGMKADPARNKMYLMEAHHYSSTGDVLIYDLNGNYQSKFSTGYLPSDVLIFD